jgi:hypothetical protein
MLKLTENLRSVKNTLRYFTTLITALLVAFSGLGATSSPANAKEVARVKAPQSVYVQGDSLTVDTIKYLPGALSKVGYKQSVKPSARIGRGVTEGLHLMMRTKGLPNTVIIALGTNNFGSTSKAAMAWVKHARAIVGPKVTIYWVNLQMDGKRYKNYRKVNEGILQGVKLDNRHQRAVHLAGRSHVLDWYGYATHYKLPHDGDGVHYTGKVSKMRAAFYAGGIAASRQYLPYILG